MGKANVAVAIIAKNAAKTIGACLDSIVPYVQQVVVCVDETTTDTTASIAKKRGALVVKDLKVSEPHECPYHGKIMAQHFARARQQSWSHLRKDVDWHMWIDSDDVVKGADKLADFLAKLPEDKAGVWLPYHYSQAGKGGPTSTLFDRERIVRAKWPWAWKFRVHEVLAPVGEMIEHLQWARTEEIAIVHQGEGHDTHGSARRNITLLEIDLEENPGDARSLFYMGNQYFALGDWQEAAQWYERATKDQNTYQLWQTYLYLSMAYEKLGRLDDAKGAAYQAIDTAPYHPEPWYRLAVIDGLMRGDVQRTEFWTAEGDHKPPAPGFAFKNPLDGPYNARITLANAYGNNGQISKARACLEAAAKVIPDENVIKGIEAYKQAEVETQLAQSMADLLDSKTIVSCVGKERMGELHDAVRNNIGLWKFGRVRDVVVPTMLANRPNTQPRIVFFCGRSAESWAPSSINTTGIGGSETAVIQIARRFAADGWRVDVFNEPDYLEGEYESVGYWGLGRFRQDERAEVFISWRNPAAYGLPIERKVSLLWCHDLNRGPSASGDMARWERVLGVSQWHAAYMSVVYGGLTNTGFVPNGIDLERFTEPTRKVPMRCVYSSSQDRGLLELLKMWPLIRQGIAEGAELHVAYGWESFDKYIAMGNGELAKLKEAILPLLEQPGVKWRGRLGQDELAKLFQESYAWLYPTTFLEVSCITAMEAMAGGCVPVTSAAGALPETIGDAGLVVSGNPYTWAWKEFWLSCVRAALMHPDTRLPLAAKGQERAKGQTWDASYEKWKEIVVPMLEGKKELEDIYAKKLGAHIYDRALVNAGLVDEEVTT